MNRLSISKWFSLVLIVTVVFSACVKDEFDAPDNGGCIDAALTRTLTIADLKSLYTGTALEITNDDIIEGVIISDDSKGNYFKELVIQDETAGILLLIDETDLFNKYPVGRKVYIKLKGLWMSDFGGLIQLGAAPDDDGDLQRIPVSVLEEFLFRGPCDQLIDTLVLTLNQLDPDVHQNRLVRLEGMLMDNNDAGVGFADPGGGGSTNRDMTDCDGSAGILRTSDFASFAATLTPTDRFNLVGVFSIFNSDYQFKIRTISDVEETAGAGCPCILSNGPIAASTRFHIDDVEIFDSQQTELLGEDFESVNDNSPISLAGWVNVAETGTLLWDGSSFSGNSYARANAFGSGQSDVRAWLVTPQVNITGTGFFLSFRNQDNFDDGAKLEVLISTDYDGGNTPWTFNWEKLCDAEIGSGTGGFRNDWVQSGAVDLSAYSGNAYIAFRYKGGE